MNVQLMRVISRILESDGQTKSSRVLPAFRLAVQKARDLQGNILIQNSLRGNYSSSFAVFTAKNLLGWKDGKEDIPHTDIVVRWEENK